MFRIFRDFSGFFGIFQDFSGSIGSCRHLFAGMPRIFFLDSFLDLQEDFQEDFPEIPDPSGSSSSGSIRIWEMSFVLLIRHATEQRMLKILLNPRQDFPGFSGIFQDCWRLAESQRRPRCNCGKWQYN